MAPQLRVLTAILLACAVSLEGGAAPARQLFAGSAGWGLLFDGFNDFAALTEQLPFGPATIELWVQPLSLKDGLGNQVAVFNTLGNLLDLSITSNTRRHLSIPYNGGELWQFAQTDFDIQAASWDPKQSDGRMYHYAYTRNSTHFAVLLDGSIVRVGKLVPGALDQAQHYEPWILGARSDYINGAWTINRNFGGIIDGLRWWSKMRTADEIRQSMAQPVQLDADGLIRQWQFDSMGDLTDGSSFVLGYGNAWKAPQYVPSPFATFGSPVAVVSPLMSGKQQVQICALLVPAVEGATLTADFLMDSKLGDLSPKTGLALTARGTDAYGRAHFCNNATFESSMAGFETLPFNVTALLPDGDVLVASQAVQVYVRPNHPPVAGMALAVEPNGVDGYVSLGQFEVPLNFTMSLWQAVVEFQEGSVQLSRHRTNGNNIMILEFYDGSYYYQLGCFKTAIGGCSVLASDYFSIPYAYRDKPHHVALTFSCLDPGLGGNPMRGKVVIYVNGTEIGRTIMKVCLFPHSDSAPWELGEEYDSAKATDPVHEPGLQVVASQWNHAVFDDVVFWAAELTAEEVRANAAGRLPRPEAIVARYTFDLDNPTDCAQRKLWDKNITGCYTVNEVNSRVVPPARFPWTNGFYGGVARDPSPFQVPGSPIHVTMEEGTCRTATLKAADADGDKVTYTAYGQLVAGAVLQGSTLQFCAGPGRQEVSIPFDACDPSHACASTYTGTANAIFHVLERGPAIVRFQALETDRVLRLVFDVATNTPPVASAGDLAKLFALTNGSMPATFGTWEDGAMALRLQVTNPSWRFEDQVGKISIQVLEKGLLRDAGELTYPSTSTSPTLASIVCPAGQLLRASRADCEPCPPGEVPRTVDGAYACQACDLGSFANGSQCDSCSVGTYADSTGQQACASCAMGASSPDNWATLQRVPGESEWVPIIGATNVSACGCRPGTLLSLPSGECRTCHTGLRCLGMGEVLLKEGYWSATSAPTSVFRCYGSASRCPGGSPGACAQNRDPESLTCAACVAGMLPSRNGSCKVCAGPDYLPVAAACAVALGVLLVVYRAAGSKSSARQPMSLMMAATAGGHCVTILQQLGVLSVISVNWPQPFASVLSVLSLLTFDVDVLSIDCVATMGPLEKFVLRVFLVVLFIAVMLFIHLLHILLIRGWWRSSTNALTGSVGAIVLAFFVSIVSNLSAPFNCDMHPNGLSTLHSFPTVLCWSGERSLHSRMLGLGAGACVLPAAFLALSISVAWRLPHELAGGNVEFLQAYSFLLFRFRTGGQWYAVLSVVRSFVVALIPVVPDVPTQLVLLWCILVASLVVNAYALPWRVPLGNVIDGFGAGVVLLVIAFGSFFVPDVSADFLGVLSVVIVGVFFLALIGVFLACVIQRLRARGKRQYQFFLCHHKGAAGAFARLLQMALSERGHGPRIFIDSDNLSELDLLFTIVATEVTNFVILCSRLILTRAWCVGELTTAVACKLPLLPIYFVDFEPPDDGFIEVADTYMDFECLARHHLELAEVQEAFRAFRQLPHMTIPAEVTSEVVSTVVEKLGRGDKDLLMHIESQRAVHAAGPCVILADCADREAMSSALVLIKLLLPLYYHQPELLPVLYQDEWRSTEHAGPAKVETLILLCTEGCFSEVGFLQGLRWARQNEIPFAVPTVAREDFRFPTPIFYEQLLRRLGPLCDDGKARENAGEYEDMPALIVEYVHWVFSKIALHFNTIGSIRLMQGQAIAINNRLKEQTLANVGGFLGRDTSVKPSRTGSRVFAQKSGKDGGSSMALKASKSMVSHSFKAIRVETSIKEWAVEPDLPPGLTVDQAMGSLGQAAWGAAKRCEAEAWLRCGGGRDVENLAPHDL